MQSTEFEYYEFVSNSNIDEESAQERSDRQSKDAPHTVGRNSEEVTDCLHYKGKKFEDLQLEDLDGVVFKSIEEVDQFYSYFAISQPS